MHEEQYMISAMYQHCAIITAFHTPVVDQLKSSLAAYPFISYIHQTLSHGAALLSMQKSQDAAFHSFLSGITLVQSMWSGLHMTEVQQEHATCTQLPSISLITLKFIMFNGKLPSSLALGSHNRLQLCVCVSH